MYKLILTDRNFEFVHINIDMRRHTSVLRLHKYLYAHLKAVDKTSAYIIIITFIIMLN